MTMLNRRPAQEDRLRVDAIEAVKDKLTPIHYDALIAWARGDSYTFIASLLGVPIGTAKSRVNRGRKEVVRATAALAHKQETA